MSGHSKWHNIQARKSKVDAVRGAVFTKMVRAIIMAAQKGGGDPTINFSLRFAVDRARDANVPKDKIEKAILSGSGGLKDGTRLESVVYEGFGPEKISIMVEAVTDNKNRTFGDIRKIFSDHGGALGGPGSVAWQFAELGVIRLEGAEAALVTDEIELAVIDAGAEDVVRSTDGVEIRTGRGALQRVLEALKAHGIDRAQGALEWVPKETVPVPEKSVPALERFLEALDEHDDVQNVFTNAA